MKSLLYHAFGVKGYRLMRTRYERGEILFEIEPSKPPEAVEGHRLVRHGFRWRRVRALSIGFKPVWLIVKVPRWRDETTGEEFEQSPPLSTPTRKSPGRSRGSSSRRRAS